MRHNESIERLRWNCSWAFCCIAVRRESQVKASNGNAYAAERGNDTSDPKWPLALRRSSQNSRPTYRDKADYSSSRKRRRVNCRVLKEASLTEAKVSEENIPAGNNDWNVNTSVYTKVDSPIILSDGKQEEASVQNLQAQNPCEVQVLRLLMIGDGDICHRHYSRSWTSLGTT